MSDNGHDLPSSAALPLSRRFCRSFLFSLFSPFIVSLWFYSSTLLPFFFFRPHAWVPGSGLGGLASPLGPWGASRELPGGGLPAQATRATFQCLPFRCASKLMSMLISFFGRFGVRFGSVLGPCSRLCSAQLGPGSIFEPSELRKSDCTRSITVSIVILLAFAQDGAPKRPKIAPRRVQDRLR